MARKKKAQPKKDPQRRLDYYGIFPPPVRNKAQAWDCKSCACYHTYTCFITRFELTGRITKHCQLRRNTLSGAAVDAFRRALNR